MKKSALVVISFMLALQGARAQDLDDAVDAELDNTTPSAAPSSGASKSSIDDVQLDESPAPVAATPAEPTEPAQAESAPTEPAPTEAAPTEPAPAIVEDTLNEPAAQTAEQPPAVEPTPAPAEDVEPSLEASTPQEVPANPADEPAPDLAGQDSPPPEAAPEELTPTDAAPEQNADAEELNIDSAPQVAQAPAAPPRESSVKMDNGNAAIEKRLSQYARGYRQVPDVNWDEIVGERRQENYSLQTGDTLWDISETFFGDGFFWAKLWSENGGVDNPHKVLRGRGIRFVAGTEGEAPAIGVVDVQANSEVISANPFKEPDLDRPTYREQVQREVSPEEVESGVVLESDELIPAPDLPAASRRVPLLRNLPASFVEPRVAAEEEYDSSGFKNVKPLDPAKAASVYVNSMILDEKPDDVGKIDEIHAQERVAGVGQGVFFKANRELAMGERLTFLKPRGKQGGGRVYDVQGIGSVDGVIKESTNTYHVTVTTALSPVELGDIALAQPPPRITVDSNGRRNEAHVKVLGGEFDDTRRLLGVSSVIYLGGGTSAGLRVGDILGISAKRGSRRETKYPEFAHAIAAVKIADVQQNFATAYVISSVEGIMPGDITGGDMPEELPSLRAETADTSASGFGHSRTSSKK